jgi:hypothetical protein
MLVKGGARLQRTPPVAVTDAKDRAAHAYVSLTVPVTVGVLVRRR